MALVRRLPLDTAKGFQSSTIIADLPQALEELLCNSIDGGATNASDCCILFPVGDFLSAQTCTLFRFWPK